MDGSTDLDGSRAMSSDYMAFAKLRTGARYNLASSGVADCALADLDPDFGALELHGDNAYGYPPLIEVIAARFGVDPACVVIPGGGCSFANHLAMAALVAPGDEVLAEAPTYELLTSTLEYLGARVTLFPRPAGALVVEEVATRVSERTRLVVLTNLHNPTSAPAGEAEIAAVARAAGEARVLVDEVYLELTFKDGVARTAFREDGNVIVTSSLTKAYGLSGLRCGWILAPPELAERMRRLNDLYGVKPPFLAEQLAVGAFARLERLRARAGAMIEANRAAYGEILAGHPALEQVVFADGATAFPRLRRGDGDAFFRLLMNDYETSVAPGRFFGAPDHIRIGLGGHPATTREGLTRVARALEATQ
jgi:hypothetical protein